jgi:hypothetical protein
MSAQHMAEKTSERADGRTWMHRKALSGMPGRLPPKMNRRWDLSIDRLQTQIGWQLINKYQMDKL